MTTSRKAIMNLVPGDTFLDTYDQRLTVEKVEEIPWLGIPRTSPRVKLYFTTSRGNSMHQNFRADRMVDVIKEGD